MQSLPITRNLTAEQFDSIDSEISKIGDTILEWTKDFNENPYKGSFWTQKNYKLWPLYALNAHRMLGNVDEDLEITAGQVASVCFQYAVVDQFIQNTQSYISTKKDVLHRVYNLTNPVKRDVRIKPEWVSINDVRFKTFLIKLIKGQKEESASELIYYFNTEDQAALIAQNIINYLKKHNFFLPKSELCLFMIDGIDNMKNHSDLLQIFSDFSVPFNGNIRINGNNFFVIPSFLILNLFYQSLSPTYPIYLEPIIGKATIQDIENSRQKNLRTVSLPINEVETNKVIDGYWGGNAGSVIHDACFHAFKVNSLSFEEHHAISYVIYSLLDPYIERTQNQYDLKLIDFFEKFNISLNNQSKIKKYLKYSNQTLDLFIREIWIIIMGVQNVLVNNQQRDSSDKLQSLLNNLESTNARLFDIHEELLQDIETLNQDKAKSALLELKKDHLKLRSTKRLRWILIDGDLWINLPKTSKTTWNPFFEQKTIASIFLINPEIFWIIYSDMIKKERFWNDSFGFTKKNNYRSLFVLARILNNMTISS